MGKQLGETMSVELILPEEYGYVGLGLISVFISNFWMGAQVSKARRKYKVPLPLLYSPDTEGYGKMFNCIQRGHQNSLEFTPIAISLGLYGGLKQPVIAAAGLGLYTLGRITYFLGYSTGDPKNRKYGFPQYIGQLMLLFAAGSTSAKLLKWY